MFIKRIGIYPDVFRDGKVKVPHMWFIAYFYFLNTEYSIVLYTKLLCCFISPRCNVMAYFTEWLFETIKFVISFNSPTQSNLFVPFYSWITICAINYYLYFVCTYCSGCGCLREGGGVGEELKVPVALHRININVV